MIESVLEVMARAILAQRATAPPPVKRKRSRRPVPPVLRFDRPYVDALPF